MHDVRYSNRGEKSLAGKSMEWNALKMYASRGDTEMTVRTVRRIMYVSVRYSTTQHNTKRSKIMRLNTIEYIILHYSALQYSTVQ